MKKGKVALGSWRLDVAKQLGAAVCGTCIGAACVAVALLQLYILKLAGWKAAQASSDAFI